MVYDRYYYSILSKADQRIYQSLYKGIEEFQKEILIPDDPEQKYPLNQILLFVGLDNPHIFYVDFYRCCIKETALTKTVVPTYWYSPKDIVALKQKTDAVLEKMLARIEGRTAYEKELSIHDMLVRNVTYNTTAADHLHQFAPRADTILGVCFYKSATCSGISKAAKLLLNLCDIKCMVAYGTTRKESSRHAWNIVKIDGSSYHLDITWDINTSVLPCISHSYLNLTDSDILRDHAFAMKYPACTSTKHNYYLQNGLLVESAQDVARVVSEAERQNKSEVIFRYVGDDQRKFDALIQAAEQRMIERAPQDKSFRLRTCKNQEQGVCSVTLERKSSHG